MITNTMNIEQITDYIKTEIDIEEYATNYLGYERKDKLTFSCPACGSKDNVKRKQGKNYLVCFGCETKGNIIDLTQAIKGVDFIGALKEICKNFDINYNFDQGRETTVETSEEIEQRKLQQKLIEDKKAKRLEQDKQDAIQLEKDKATSIQQMTKKSYVFSKRLSDDKSLEMMKAHDKLFPHTSKEFVKWCDQYIGYDDKHQSFCILNRTKDGKTYDIKTREKYIWDKENKVHLAQRVDSKWRSYHAPTSFAFPYDYFAQHQSDTVFITEGEKDALNLLSYGINTLTLGGAGTSWEQHKHLLKDKIVYIWFDNDHAGYKGAIKRFKETSEVAKATYITLFFQINRNLADKYDISDFIADKNFRTKDEIIHALEFSSHTLNNEIIKDIESYTDLDLSKDYFIEKFKTVQDIKKIWVSKDKDKNPINIITVKGQKDIKGLKEFMDRFKKKKNLKDFKTHTVNALANNLTNVSGDPVELATQYVEMIEMMIQNYKTFDSKYSQTSIADMVRAFRAMTEKTGFSLAKFGESICVWTGTHYEPIKESEDDLLGFIYRKWMPLAHVDANKVSTRNAKEIKEDLYTGALSINEVRHYYQKDKRVINFTNGTMFITDEGKVTFKNIHDKKDVCTNLLAFDYDPNATCKNFQKFLDISFPNKDNQATILEFIGYCFMPSHRYEAFLYFYGEAGANGKSVLLDLLKKFFGENYSNLNIQQMHGHELEALVNKFVNIGSEFNSKNLKDSQMDNVKALTSTNDDISINPKFGKPFTLKSINQPKIVSAGNIELNPSTLDGGVLRRALQINCNVVIAEEDRIMDLSKRFNSELAGILNLVLKHLENLIKNNGFTKSQEMKDTIKEYKDKANPIRRYIKECLNANDDVMIPKDLLYAHYKEYMEHRGYELKSVRFFEELKKEIKGSRDMGQIRGVVVDSIDNNRPRFFRGVSCKSSEVFSFKFNNQQINTSSINYGVDSKSITLIDENDSKKES